MNDIAGAIGTIQLRRLPKFLERRREIARLYSLALADLDWITPPPEPEFNETVSWYFYWIQTSPNVRNSLAYHLRQRQIYTTFRYWPLHKTRLYASSRQFPGANQASATTLLLPCHNGLSNADLDSVVVAIRDFAPQAAKLQ